MSAHLFLFSMALRLDRTPPTLSPSDSYTRYARINISENSTLRTQVFWTS